MKNSRHEFSFDIFSSSFLMPIFSPLKVFRHLVLNLCQSNSEIHLNTSMRLFWNHPK
jgi:hypothetical protein